MLSDRRETSVPSLLGGWLLHPGQCVRARLPGARVRALLQVKIEGVKYIFYYKNYLPPRKHPSIALSVLLPPCSMRSICLVITLLHPRDEVQDLCNGIRP